MEHFSRRPLFRFLTQPDTIIAINSITADNIFDYYQRERPDSDISQLYHMIAKDLEDVLGSNFFKEDTMCVLKDIKYTWVTWKKQRVQLYKDEAKISKQKTGRNVQFQKCVTKYQRGVAKVTIAEVDKWVEEAEKVNKVCENKEKRKRRDAMDTKETDTSPEKKTKITTSPKKQENKVITNKEEETGVAVETNVVKRGKINELFDGMRNRNIYILCEPFRPLSEMDAEDRFDMIAQNTSVEIDLPKDIKKYLHCLLSGDIINALSEVEKPLHKDTRPLMLWTREVCRHFLFYYYYGGLQIDSDEKTWSNQTVYRILDLFSMFFGKLTSGISFGEIINEAHKDRVYNINADQKPSNSRRGDKNDAVLYQDDNATIIYEQSFGPQEFDATHYMGDITKLARNGVDD